MEAHETLVNITSVSKPRDVATTELRLWEGDWPAVPLAPASVWPTDEDAPLLPVTDLYRLVKMSSDTATFESYERPQRWRPFRGRFERGGLTIGGPFRFTPWWSHSHLEVAQDLSLDWRKRKYDGTEHDHCLLTWVRINPGDVAYSSDAGWISTDAFAQFIRDDFLHMRRRSR